MGFAILPPSAEEEQETIHGVSDDSSDNGSRMAEDEISVRPTKRIRISEGHSTNQIVLPGELITSETQWMR